MWFKRRDPQPPAPIEHADDKSFEELVLKSNGLAVVDFWATWCPPCRMIEPILGEVATEYQERGVRVVKVDTDQARETAAMFDIRSIPTLIFFRDGEPLFELVGAVPKPVLVREIEAALS